MKLGVPISIGLHAFAVGFGLIAFSGEAKPFEDSRVIPIELVSLSEETNISAAIRKPKESLPEAEDDTPMTLNTPMTNAPEESETMSERTDEAVEKLAEATLPDRRLDIADEALENETETADVQKPVFDLDKLSGLVDKKRSSAPEKNQQKTLQSEQNSYRFAETARAGSGAGTDMTVSEFDALQSAMYQCWRMPADAKNPEKLVVTVGVRLLPGGFVESAALKNKTQNRRRDPDNPFWDVAEQRAVRAVSQCAPYDFLPAEKYSNWRDLTLNFAPQL